MSHLTYPTAGDIESLMRSTGYWPTDASKQALAIIQAQVAEDAAVDNWEHFTGWTPFLAQTEATTRVFDAIDHSGLLNLEAGAVEIVSVSVNGVLQTPNQNYYLSPRNAIAQKKAITALDFGERGIGSYLLYPHYSRGGIEVTAKWGRVSEIPGDVWQAIQQLAALVVLTQVENLQSVASISQDGFTKAYDVVGIVTQKDLAAGGAGGGGIWGRNFLEIAKRWKRVVC